MGSLPNAKEMLATVRAWLALNYPGCTLECLKIRVHGIKKSIRIYETPVQSPVVTEVLMAKQPPPTMQAKPLNDEETVIENGEASTDDDSLRLEDFENVKPGAEEDIVSVLIAAEKPLRATQIAVRAQSELTDHFRRSIYALAKKEIVKNVADNRYWLVVRPLPLTS